MDRTLAGVDLLALQSLRGYLALCQHYGSAPDRDGGDVFSGNDPVAVLDAAFGAGGASVGVGDESNLAYSDDGGEPTSLPTLEGTRIVWQRQAERGANIDTRCGRYGGQSCQRVG